MTSSLCSCTTCRIWAITTDFDLKTGRLRHHRREDNITKLIPVTYDESATCPIWEKTLYDTLEDVELIRYFQKAVGYCLTGDTSEQCFFILHGNGSNGKSTFLGVMREILADYHRKTGTDTLLDKEAGGPSNDIARLRGARLVSAIEAKPGKRLAEALLKELTGSDPVTARFLHQEFFEFVPQFKLWLACNHLPYVDGQDYGIWRRIRLIPFRVQFQDSDSPTGPYKDMMLLDKLRMEYPGILLWMVTGCLLWQSERLDEPKAIKKATCEYRSDMDVLADFFNECCFVRTDCKAKSSTLHTRYLEWSKSRGEKFSLPIRAFNQRVAERGMFQKYQSNGCYWWRGIGLRDVSIVDQVDDVDSNTLFSCMKEKHEQNRDNDSTLSTSSTLSVDEEEI